MIDEKLNRLYRNLACNARRRSYRRTTAFDECVNVTSPASEFTGGMRRERHPTRFSGPRIQAEFREYSEPNSCAGDNMLATPTDGCREMEKAQENLRKSGGEAGIRTLGTGLSPYNGLANRRFRPLSHLTGARDERRGYRTRGAQGLQQLVAASLRTRRGIDTNRLSFFLSEPAAGAARIASSAAFSTLADAESDGISNR